MIHLVSLTEEEYRHAMVWLDDHAKTCPWAGGKEYAGAIGGVISWRGVNTSIGQIVTLHCTCGAEHYASEGL